MRAAWAHADLPSRRACAICRLPMRAVRPVSGVEIECCRRCHVIWFDRDEIALMPRRPLSQARMAVPGRRAMPPAHENESGAWAFDLACGLLDLVSWW
ncbi:MAG TPA: hypothetical protein VEL07_11630 [Planctomycetota bacterium]|nr:hypothetical protein [Planctomycetota bacterium]